jgi:hypothetical protein
MAGAAPNAKSYHTLVKLATRTLERAKEFGDIQPTEEDDNEEVVDIEDQTGEMETEGLSQELIEEHRQESQDIPPSSPGPRGIKRTSCFTPPSSSDQAIAREDETVKRSKFEEEEAEPKDL